MKTAPYHILRVGMAITFIWIGILIFSAPEAWGSVIQPWAADLLPVPLREAMIGTAILDIAVGVLLLVDILTWLAALFGAIHLVIVLAAVGINTFTVRDIGLLAGAIALFISDVEREKCVKAKISHFRAEELI
jgi:uncharacterized membrane protein YphA (DoxX/SURF4 family)